MMEYTLFIKSDDNEIINKTKSHSLGEAIEYFAKIKNLKKEDLLKIYGVDKLTP